MADKPQLFGTDGVRGVAGRYPLDRATVWKLGRALAGVLSREKSAGPLRVVLGEDTRQSSRWISASFAAGLRSLGVEPSYAGVLTTPGVAYLTRRHGFAAGESPAEGAADPPLAPQEDLLAGYVDYLAEMRPPGRHQRPPRLVVDCAHGAASRVIPVLAKRLGIEARILHAEPNGRNINAGCGSLHPKIMGEETRAAGADLGVAFDGDADRAIFATSEGRILDGDFILYAAATFLDSRGSLKGRAVVGTSMTNLGLELALAEHGIGLKRAPVGDKYVLEEMLRSQINLGGEPSGHIIFSDISVAGDGIITLLQVLRMLEETGRPFGELVSGLRQFPQIIRNVRVKEKPPLDSLPEVARAIADCQREFVNRGRVVVRYSGTEPLARVMVEAEQAEAVERHAARIAQAIESKLGIA